MSNAFWMSRTGNVAATRPRLRDEGSSAGISCSNFLVARSASGTVGAVNKSKRSSMQGGASRFSITSADNRSTAWPSLMVSILSDDSSVRRVPTLRFRVNVWNWHEVVGLPWRTNRQKLVRDGPSLSSHRMTAERAFEPFTCIG